MARDPITERILAAALRIFGTVGFKATTLSEIALAADISRPTLYARYPDKVHLFRAVIEQAYVDSLSDAAATAQSDGALAEILSQVLFDYYGGLFDRFHGLPQIDELALMQIEHAQDIVADARKRMKKILTDLLRRRIRAAECDIKSLDVSIPQLVELLRLTPLSIKQADTTRTQYRKGLRSLARVVAAALRAGLD
jgi:AcrR family transcriptional regulator